MSRKLLRAYRFATEDQWNACLFASADRETKDSRSGLRPFASYGGPATRFETQGGHAPAIGCTGDVLWRDDATHLQRLPYGDDKPDAMTAPYAIAHATRLVASSSALWGAADDDSLQAFELESLARQFAANLAGASVIDIAGDGHDGVFVLLKRHSISEIARFDCAGRETSRFKLEDIRDPSGLVYLARTGQLVVLAAHRSRLHWIAPGAGSPLVTVLLTAIRSCFTATALGSDGRARLLLAGTDGAPFGGRHHVLTLDSEGTLLGDLEIPEAATGVTANRAQLLVTTVRGLLRFETSQTISADSSDVKATLITPMLQPPATEDTRRWLRAEATVILPPGCTLEISYAATDDPEILNTARSIADDGSLSATQKITRLRDRLGPWQTVSFHGNAASAGEDGVPLSAPLFDVRAQYLWVSINLIASPGGGIPVLSELAVLYPGRTLMENLPSIYQRAEAQPGSFLRSFVGVLEATTQNLDAHIGDLGRNIHPQTASGPWLDFVAGWLGLPWDDALSLDQKRRIALRASDIASGYGTRAGLEALLESLMPEIPRRFRVVDSAVDFGLATVGGQGCDGSALPAMLGGLPSTATELGNKAILGKARLPCADVESDTARLIGRVRVDVSANAEEQAAWEPWLRTLIGNMVPATTRVQLRWLSGIAFRQDMRLDDGLELDNAPQPHLGTGAITGIARLPDRRGASLPRSGLDSGTQLH